jgi:hypothetical protein
MALRMNEHNNGYMAMGKYAVWTSDVNANDKPDLTSCPVFATLSWRTRMQSMPSVAV